MALREMAAIEATPWDKLAERHQWNWLGHIARGRTYTTLMLHEMDALPTINITTDVKRKVGRGWMDRAQDRFWWKFAFEDYYNEQLGAAEGSRSQIITRAMRRQQEHDLENAAGSAQDHQTIS